MPRTKHLCVTALVALCMSVTASAVLAADSWKVLGSEFPIQVEWDESANVWVDTQNTGTTTWDSSYGLLSVTGVTVSAIPTDRWGLKLVPIVGITVAPMATHKFEFAVWAPPFTTLKYLPPVTPTESGVGDYLDANFILAHPVTPTPTLVTTDTALNQAVISRFPDIQPGTLGYWARFEVEELSGRAPYVVLGFLDGTYGPRLPVQRDAMAVFMCRTLKLPTGPYQGKFRDIASNFWACKEIEALASTDIVEGFPDGTYGPYLVVDRGTMAVFVARGMVGGESLVPPGPLQPSFPDVPPVFWAYDHIEYAVSEDVVKGYLDGTYRPLTAVERDQMAVFLWRAFIMPTGVPVALAGPDTTSAGDPATLPYLGWSSDGQDPDFAYVAFDAVRLDTNLVFPKTPSGTWDVTFELRPGDSPTAAASHTISFYAADITKARNAAMTTGDPYLVLSWDLRPLSLPAGTYHLVVMAGDEKGVMRLVPMSGTRQGHVSFS